MDLPSHLLPSRLPRAAHERGDYLHRAAAGVTLDMVLNPNYWAHLAERLRIGDRIEALADDGSFDVDLRVVAIDPRGHWALVRTRPSVSAAMPAAPFAGPAPDADGYTIDRDPVQGWRILRGRDLIAKDFADEAAAREALAGVKGTPKRGKAA